MLDGTGLVISDMSQAFGRLPAGHRHALPDARRANRERLQREIGTASHHPVVHALLSAVDAILLVLNEERQVVAFNSRVAAVRQPADVLGLRPGEAFGCVNAQAVVGCGAAPTCQTCGALGAILTSQQQGHSVEAEWVMVSAAGGGLEFNVRATPVLVERIRFTVVSLRDISSEKRRHTLEQIFFHDVLNTVTGLRGWTELLRISKGLYPEATERIELLSRHIEREIRDHRALVMAERGTLVASPERLRAAQTLGDLEAIFALQFAARERRLEVKGAGEIELETDPSLLLRVLVNMVRNAFEASEPGSTVRVVCDRGSGAGGEPDGREGTVRFSVRNDGVMPPEVQERIFSRSFSTKSRQGRGLGTYSMKLLGEQYLGGKVSFLSNEQSGTVFFFDVPRRLPEAGVAGDLQKQHVGEALGPRPTTPPGPEWVSGDSERTDQIAGDLIDNRGGAIDVTVRSAKSGQPDLVVQDEGIAGMGAEVLAHSAGLGLGSDSSARFFPASPPASPRPPPVEPAGRVGRRRILVIEDNQDVRESFVDYLRSRFAYEVEFAEDGETGVAKAREWKPELVFCDIGLPRLDGYEVARRLRDEPSLRGIVLVAMTGYGGEGDRARADEAGFDHHYTKPIDIDALKRFLDSLPLRHGTDRSIIDFGIATAVTPAGGMLKDPGGTPTSNA